MASALPLTMAAASCCTVSPFSRLAMQSLRNLGLNWLCHPLCTLQELYRTLQYCGVAWKKNGPYNLKCRAVLRLHPSAHDSGSGTPNGDAARAASLDRRGSDDSMATMEDVSPQSLAAAGSGGGPLAMAVAAEDAREARAAAAAAAASDAADAAGGDAGGGGGQALEKEVKFEAQLYKMRDGEYSLDFQVRTAWHSRQARGQECAQPVVSAGSSATGGDRQGCRSHDDCSPQRALSCLPAAWHPCWRPGTCRPASPPCGLPLPHYPQRLSGDLFLFMDTCSSLLSVLRL